MDIMRRSYKMDCLMRELRKYSSATIVAIAVRENNQYTTMSINLYRSHYSNDFLEIRVENLFNDE
jgi:hypothetical protein